MKTLDERAVKILIALLEQGKLTIDSTKEVHATIVHSFGQYRIITITLFRTDKEEDWQFREPEITILHDTVKDEYIPSGICNDYAHIQSNSANIYNGVLTVWNEKIQADHAEYVNGWLETLAKQLNIKL